MILAQDLGFSMTTIMGNWETRQTRRRRSQQTFGRKFLSLLSPFTFKISRVNEEKLDFPEWEDPLHHALLEKADDEAVFQVRKNTTNKTGISSM